MPKLTPEQEKQLEEDIKSPAYKDGILRIADLSRKYNLTWKRTKDAVNRIETKIKYQDPNYKVLPEATIPHEELNDLEKTDEEKEILFVKKHDETKPKLSLIPPPPTNQSNVLDGSKFYCGTCIRMGKQTILETTMKNCPTCQGVLLWEN